MPFWVVLLLLVCLPHALGLDCFHFRRDYVVSSSGVTAARDIQLVIDTAALIAGGNITDCTGLRFRQQRTATWLDYYYESACNKAATRVWVSPTFDDGPETIEVYYHCLDGNGVLQTPPAFGIHRIWGDKFITFRRQSCGSGWTQQGDFTNRFVRAKDNGVGNTRSGSWAGHGHSTNSETSATGDVSTVRRTNWNPRCSAPRDRHKHYLSGLNVADPNPDKPPYYTMWACESDYLDLVVNSLVPVVWDYTFGTSGRWRQATAFPNRFIYVNNNDLGSTGGGTTHTHLLSGSVGACDRDVGDSSYYTGSNSPTCGHTHSITSVTTSGANSLPPYIPTVFAYVISDSMAILYDETILYMAYSTPPKGFQIDYRFEDVYMRAAAAASGGNEQNPSTGTHTVASVSIGAVNAKLSFYDDGDSDIDVDDHSHTASYVSSDTPDIWDHRRVEPRMIRYVDNRFQLGVTPQTPVQLQPLHHCNNIFWSRADVCTNRGTCVDWDDCTCDADPWWGVVYGGNDCQVEATCNTVLWRNGACNGHGHCSLAGACTCDIPEVGWGHVYHGQWCGTKVQCSGDNFDSSTTCSTVGNCTSITPGSATGVCYCNEMAIGADCQTPLCNELPATQTADVCSGGRGSCDSYNLCSCFPVPVLGNVWSGTDCEIPTICGTKAHTDPMACSYGNCTEGSLCKCDINHRGAVCDIALCFGVDFDNYTYVCNGFGACFVGEFPYCVCDANHYGPNCENGYTCYGDDWDSATVCTNGQGDCRNADDNCVCKSGYSGTQCEFPSCWGYNSTDPLACNAVGSCVALEVCTCPPIWLDQFCHIPTSCGSVPFNDSASCNLGTCGVGGVCTCDALHTDTLCDEPICNGVRKTNTSYVCSGFGTCMDGTPPYCSCDWNHYGSDCELGYVCYGKTWDDSAVCSNRQGSCAYADNNCVCLAGQYVGKQCEVPYCNFTLANETGVCSDRGNCTSFDTCSCELIWRGQFCHLPTFCGGIPHTSIHSCRNGTCTPGDPGVCACDALHTDTLCDEPICNGVRKTLPATCSGHGTCNEGEPPFCTCDFHHYGIDCERKYMCFGYDWDDARVCTNGRGQCHTANDLCHCEAPKFEGPNCEYAYCEGTRSDDPSVCSTFGNCTDFEICDCDPLHTLTYCTEDVRCGQFKWNDVAARACRGRGSCIGEDNCDCDAGYSGGNCEVTQCFNVPDQNPHTCNGQGLCYGADLCMCFDNYYGRNCEEYLPENAVVVKGLTTDVILSFTIPYYVHLKEMFAKEANFVEFPCSERILTDSVLEIGENAKCAWLPNPQNKMKTLGVNVTIVDADALAFKNGADNLLKVGVLTSFNEFDRANIDLRTVLSAPKIADDSSSAVTAGVTIPLVLIAIGGVLLGVVLFLIIFFFKKKQKRAREELFRKQRELLKVQEMYLSDTRSLQEKMRQFQLEGGARKPVEYLRSTGGIKFGQPLLDDPIWGPKCQCCLATWDGKPVIAKRFDFPELDDADTFAKIVRKFGSLPPNDGIRRYFAYAYSGDPAAGEVPMSQVTGQVDVLVEHVANGHVISFLRKKRIEACRLLGGIDVHTGVASKQKALWLLEIVKVLRFMKENDMDLPDLNPRCILLDNESHVIMDHGMPHALKKRLSLSPFAAPEVVMDYCNATETEENIYLDFALEAEGEDVEFQASEAAREGKAEVYSFAITAWCILTESDDPFPGKHTELVDSGGAHLPPPKPKASGVLLGMLTSAKEELKKEAVVEDDGRRAARLGRIAAQDPTFRPSMEYPEEVLPAWARNLLRRCWDPVPAERPSLELVEEVLTGVFAVESVAVAAGVGIVGAEDDDFEDWIPT